MQKRLTRRSKPQAAAQSVIPVARTIEMVDINDIVPYEYNARDNAKAVQSVANSITQFGFWMPCVLDSYDVLIAGHTRVEAAKLLGMDEVPCVRADHLTPEQVNAFRLIDNKVAEIADWDFDLLAGEMSKLDGFISWTDFGWSQAEVDCLSSVVAQDCLSASNLVPEEEEERGRAGERRAPTTARVVIGEIVFFVPATAYRNWVDGIRRLHDYDEDLIAEDLKRRLGFLE